MQLTATDQQTLREFFDALAETSIRLKTGPDPERTLELLIEASRQLTSHLEAELAELRLEQAE